MTPKNGLLRRGRATRQPARRASLGLTGVALCLGLLSLGSGCKKRSPPAPERPIASAAPVASVAPAPKLAGEQRPIGPRQLVVPGRGITAIRFGATVDTIERHMQAPCDMKTESRCLYVKHAMDFTLEKGVLVRAKVERRDRPVPGVPGQVYGTFHGGMAPAVMLGLHRHIVHEEFGPPDRSEAVPAPLGLGLVQRDFYSGLTLEYDRIANGNLVLSALEVFPADNPAVPRPAATKPTNPPAGASPPAAASPPAGG
jgi:hypothetical protein